MKWESWPRLDEIVLELCGRVKKELGKTSQRVYVTLFCRGGAPKWRIWRWALAFHFGPFI